MGDSVGTSDKVMAGISTEVTTPEFPCPECGKATKDNNTIESHEAGLNLRICSSKSCRYKADWSTGSPKPYSEP